MNGALNEAEAFTNLIEALKVAETSAKQLAYWREQREWLLVEGRLGDMREMVTALATRRLHA